MCHYTMLTGYCAGYIWQPVNKPFINTGISYYLVWCVTQNILSHISFLGFRTRIFYDASIFLYENAGVNIVYLFTLFLRELFGHVSGSSK